MYVDCLFSRSEQCKAVSPNLSGGCQPKLDLLMPSKLAGCQPATSGLSAHRICNLGAEMLTYTIAV